MSRVTGTTTALPRSTHQAPRPPRRPAGRGPLTGEGGHGEAATHQEEQPPDRDAATGPRR